LTGRTAHRYGASFESDLLDRIRRMIRTRTAGLVAAMIPDRLCCPASSTEAASGLGALARP
jgi:hypothetical protein